jgi:hypothetical protein
MTIGKRLIDMPGQRVRNVVTMKLIPPAVSEMAKNIRPRR